MGASAAPGRLDLLNLTRRLNEYDTRQALCARQLENEPSNAVLPGRCPLFQFEGGLWVPARLLDDPAWRDRVPAPDRHVPAVRAPTTGFVSSSWRVQGRQRTPLGRLQRTRAQQLSAEAEGRASGCRLLEAPLLVLLLGPLGPLAALSGHHWPDLPLWRRPPSSSATWAARSSRRCWSASAVIILLSTGSVSTTSVSAVDASDLLYSEGAWQLHPGSDLCAGFPRG